MSTSISPPRAPQKKLKNWRPKRGVEEHEPEAEEETPAAVAATGEAPSEEIVPRFEEPGDIGENQRVDIEYNPHAVEREEFLEIIREKDYEVIEVTPAP